MVFHIGRKPFVFKKDRNTEELIKYDRLSTIFELLIEYPRKVTIRILKAENYRSESGRRKYQNGEELTGIISRYCWYPRVPKAGQIFNDVSNTLIASGGIIFFEDNDDEYINMEDINSIRLARGPYLDIIDLFPWRRDDSDWGEDKLNNKEYVRFITDIIKYGSNEQ